MNTDVNILLADHSSTIRKIVKDLLVELGFSSIVEADDGRAALDRIREGGIDLLITDWAMPGLSGVELVRSVRRDEALKDLPIMMATASATREQILEAAQAGVDSYVVKPFTPEALEGKISMLLGEAEA